MVRERGNCLLLRSIAISLLLAVALYSLILVTWPLFCHSCSLFPWTCPLLSTMSLNLATLWSFCPLCPESHSCSLWTVTWPLLFTMPCNLATLVHYAVLLGLSCSLCPGTWPLLSTMSWNLATLVNYVLELGHSWPLLSTMSWKLATLGRSCLLFPGTWPLLALLTLDLTTLGCLLFSELITFIVKSTNESFRNL